MFNQGKWAGKLKTFFPLLQICHPFGYTFFIRHKTLSPIIIPCLHIYLLLLIFQLNTTPNISQNKGLGYRDNLPISGARYERPPGWALLGFSLFLISTNFVRTAFGDYLGNISTDWLVVHFDVHKLNLVFILSFFQRIGYPTP